MEIKNNKIYLNRELSYLDKFVLKFVKILEKRKIDYIIVSGYIPILLGRSRGTEDVDIIIKKLEYGEVEKLFEEMKDEFWCLNSENPKEIFELLKESNARFARTNEIIPNIELKFARNKIEKLALENKIRVDIKGKSLYISPIELQIAYKEDYLKSQKDKEDALHLRELFKDKLKPEKIKEYKRLVKEL